LDYIIIQLKLLSNISVFGADLTFQKKKEKKTVITIILSLSINIYVTS